MSAISNPDAWEVHCPAGVGAHKIIAERERLGLLLCPECSGYGTVPTEIESSQGHMYLRSTCRRCNGNGLSKLKELEMSWSEMLDHIQEQSAEPQGAAIERLMAIESATKTVIRLMHDWRTPNILGVKMRDALANLEVAYKMRNDGDQETRKLDEAKTDYLCL
jgi:hypothetical protein